MSDAGSNRSFNANPHTQMTVLLQAAASGDSVATSKILPLVYEELRRMAQANMAGEIKQGAGHTLQPTALVHEAYVRLVGEGDSSWNSRGHFFGAAALAMRRILIERARARNAQKRGGNAARIELHHDAAAADPGDDTAGDEKAGELLALDQALEKLQKLDERAAQVVMLRYFAGLSVEQIATALDISLATVKRSWVFARAWLNREIATNSPSRA